MEENIKEIMHDIIFGKETKYEIAVMKYISDIKSVDSFTSKIVKNLRKSGVIIKDEILIITKDSKKFIIKIKR